MTTRRKLLWPVLVLLLTLGGCELDALNPITPVESAQNDAALFGLWRVADEADAMYVHIGPQEVPAHSDDSGWRRIADPHRLQIVSIEHRETGIKQDSYVAHVSRVGQQRFLNMQNAKRGDDSYGYFFMRYAFADKNTLRASLIDSKALAAMIEMGRIKGEVKDGVLTEAVITADSAEIADFLARNQAGLFAKPVVLKRVPASALKR
jgi:hypothetical protein